MLSGSCKADLIIFWESAVLHLKPALSQQAGLDPAAVAWLAANKLYLTQRFYMNHKHHCMSDFGSVCLSVSSVTVQAAKLH